MGPLFSAIAVATVGLVVFLVIFIAARLVLPTRRVALLSFIACLGGGVGVAIAVVAAVPFVGVGEPLKSSGAVVGYLSALFISGVLGSALSSWAFLQHKNGGGSRAS
jgi:hypothetical protein